MSACYRTITILNIKTFLREPWTSSHGYRVGLKSAVTRQWTIGNYPLTSINTFPYLKPLSCCKVVDCWQENTKWRMYRLHRVYFSQHCKGVVLYCSSIQARKVLTRAYTEGKSCRQEPPEEIPHEVIPARMLVLPCSQVMGPPLSPCTRAKATNYRNNFTHSRKRSWWQIW